MMETFLVLGLCFILYEALDFFQGCIHSNTPSPSDQIEAYRRELDEQRQQQQQEQFLASFSPLLGAHFAAAAAAAAAGSQSSLDTTTPTASTASIISDSYEQSQTSQQQQQQQQQQSQPHSLSTPGLFRPALGGYQICYDPENPLHATSSLPRDYYYLQQQQLKNKASSKSLLSKFSSTNSDNRIYPEAAAAHGVLGVSSAAVITTQPLPVGEAASLFDCQPPLPQIPASPLLVELKRAIISSNQRQGQGQVQLETRYRSSSSSGCNVNVGIEDEDQYEDDEEDNDNDNDNDNEDDDGLLSDENCGHCDEDELSCARSSQGSSSSCQLSENPLAAPATSEPNICLASARLLASSHGLLPRIHHIAIDDIGIGVGGQTNGETNSGASLAASSHADFREIECERLRRKCVSVKRIYSISEKF